jgi:hypothetical protein
MEQDGINPLYAQLSLLKVQLNAARVEYNDALTANDKITAADAWQRWKLAEQELVLVAMKCDRRRGGR